MTEPKRGGLEGRPDAALSHPKPPKRQKQAKGYRKVATQPKKTKKSRLNASSPLPARKLEKKMDVLASQLARHRDKHICQKCGGKGTQVHHIHSRIYKNIRHNLDNLVTLCYACHLHWAEKKHEEFRIWIIDRITELGYRYLYAKALMPKDLFQAEFETSKPEEYEELQRLAKEMGYDLT